MQGLRVRGACTQATEHLVKCICSFRGQRPRRHDLGGGAGIDRMLSARWKDGSGLAKNMFGDVAILLHYRLSLVYRYNQNRFELLELEDQGHEILASFCHRS